MTVRVVVLLVSVLALFLQPSVAQLNGEQYDCYLSLDGGAMEVFWSTDATTVRMAAQAVARGYVSVGFDPKDNGHVQCDMIVGGVQGSSTEYVEDHWSVDYSGIFYDGAVFGPSSGMSHLTSFSAIDDGEVTMIAFERLLDTGDIEDKALKVGGGQLTKLVWAYDKDDYDASSQAVVPQHDSDKRGTIFVDLETCEFVSIRDTFGGHYSLMMGGWIGFLAVGSIAGAYFKSDPTWHVVHSVMQTLGVLCVVLGAIVGMWVKPGSPWHSHPHGILGVLLLVGLFGQLIAGAVTLQRQRLYAGPASPKHRALHRGLGFLVVLAGLANMFLGLAQLDVELSDPRVITTATGAAVGVLALVYSAGVSHFGAARKPIGPSADKRNSFNARAMGKMAGELDNVLPNSTSLRKASSSGVSGGGSQRRRASSHRKASAGGSSRRAPAAAAPMSPPRQADDQL